MKVQTSGGYVKMKRKLISELLMIGLAAGGGLTVAAAPSFGTFHDRAEQGETLTVVFFGASLTWGANATDPNQTGFRPRVARRFEQAYPRARFRFIDAAIGGTGSQLGRFRVDRDVLRHRPDLVFVDFSANDDLEWTSPETMASYEAIIRRILTEAQAPVVQMIFPFRWHVERESIDHLYRRTAHIALSEAYATACGDAVSLIHAGLRSGAIDKRDVWPFDGVHPGDIGYGHFADAAWAAYAAAAAARQVCRIQDEPLHGSQYAHAVRARLATLAPLPDGWSTAHPSVSGPLHDMLMSRWLDTLAVGSPLPDADPAIPPPLEVRLRGSMIMLFGESTPRSARFRVLLDGEPVARPGAKDDDADRFVFDAGVLGRRIGGPVHLSLVLASGLDASQERTLRLEPLDDGSGEPRELRVESICVAGADAVAVRMDTAYGPAQRFAEAIAAFEEAAREAPPPAGAIVATGSSSMRGWHGAIADDLAPLTVIPRGFGGSNMNDLLHFADRVILAPQPRAVLIYEGDNDIAGGIPPEMVRDVFTQLVAVLHARRPGLRIYLLSIKPSPRRWDHWPAMQQANALLAAVCETDPRLTYIDVATPMLGAEGEPIADLYAGDRLHLSRAGYELWTGLVRDILVAREADFD